MNLFNRDPSDNLVDISYLDQYQYGEADPKTEAVSLMHQTYAEYDAAGLHPWDAPDGTRLQLALAGVAYAQDRTAEILLNNAGIVSTMHGQRVPADIEAFAGELSRTAHDRLRAAKAIDPEDPDVRFGTQTVIDLNAENMTPAWPEPSQASNSFIRGIVLAAKELEAEAYFGLQAMQAAERGPMPEIYNLAGQTAAETIDKYLSQPAAQHLAAADHYVDSLEHITPEQKAEALRAAHDAFIGMMGAYIAVLTPNAMGDAWHPDN